MTFAERWTGLLRYAALLVIFLLVYLLVLRPVKKQVLGILKQPDTRGSRIAQLRDFSLKA